MPIISTDFPSTLCFLSPLEKVSGNIKWYLTLPRPKEQFKRPRKKIKQWLCLRQEGNVIRMGWITAWQRREKNKPKPKYLIILFQSMLRSRLCKQQPNITGWKTQNYFVAHHILFSSNRHWDSRGTWGTTGLFITTWKQRWHDWSTWTELLPVTEAISQGMDLNVSVRAVHAAGGLSVHPQMKKKIFQALQPLAYNLSPDCNSLTQQESRYMMYLSPDFFFLWNFCCISETEQGWNLPLTEMNQLSYRNKDRLLSPWYPK